MIELKKSTDSDSEYKLSFNIQPLADKMGITKDKCAELLADQLLKILFPGTL